MGNSSATPPLERGAISGAIAARKVSRHPFRFEGANYKWAPTPRGSHWRLKKQFSFVAKTSSKKKRRRKRSSGTASDAGSGGADNNKDDDGELAKPVPLPPPTTQVMWVHSAGCSQVNGKYVWSGRWQNGAPVFRQTGIKTNSDAACFLISREVIAADDRRPQRAGWVIGLVPNAFYGVPDLSKDKSGMPAQLPPSTGWRCERDKPGYVGLWPPPRVVRKRPDPSLLQSVCGGRAAASLEVLIDRGLDDEDDQERPSSSQTHTPSRMSVKRFQQSPMDRDRPTTASPRPTQRYRRRRRGRRRHHQGHGRRPEVSMPWTINEDREHEFESDDSGMSLDISDDDDDLGAGYLPHVRGSRMASLSPRSELDRAEMIARRSRYSQSSTEERIRSLERALLERHSNARGRRQQKPPPRVDLRSVVAAAALQKRKPRVNSVLNRWLQNPPQQPSLIPPIPLSPSASRAAAAAARTKKNRAQSEERTGTVTRVLAFDDDEDSDSDDDSDDDDDKPDGAGPRTPPRRLKQKGSRVKALFERAKMEMMPGKPLSPSVARAASASASSPRSLAARKFRSTVVRKVDRRTKEPAKESEIF